MAETQTGERKQAGRARRSGVHENMAIDGGDARQANEGALRAVRRTMIGDVQLDPTILACLDELSSLEDISAQTVDACSEFLKACVLYNVQSPNLCTPSEQDQIIFHWENDRTATKVFVSARQYAIHVNDEQLLYTRVEAADLARRVRQLRSEAVEERL